MKTKVLLIFIISFSAYVVYSQCNEKLVQICLPTLKEYTFLKSFPVELKKTKKGALPETLKKSLIFNAGVRYRITACNAADYDGKVIVDFSNAKKIILSTLEYETGNINVGFDFDCKVTGVYYLSLYFKDGLAGCSTVLISQILTETDSDK